jgi:hypothetical protein
LFAILEKTTHHLGKNFAPKKCCLLWNGNDDFKETPVVLGLVQIMSLIASKH